MKKVQTTCNYCSLACNFDFYVEGEEIKKVIPTKKYPVNQGFSCIKGLTLDRQLTVYRPNPLPRIKKEDGTFAYVPWQEAYDYTAKRFLEIQKKYGNESIAGISTGQLSMEEFALIGHVMRNFMKTNLDGNTRLCMATSVVAHKQSFGFDAPPYTLKDIELSDTIIFIGANPVIAHPILWGRLCAARTDQKKVIVIDPRKSETAMNADYWYPIRPKADLVFLYTLAGYLIRQGYVDQEYIDAHTENYEAFSEHVKKFTLDEVEEKTNISKEQLIELAEMIHNGKRVSFWWTMGINQGYEAVRSAQAIINLALMTGNIGRPGTGANSLTGQCDAMGSRAFSHQAGMYGGGDFDNPARREALKAALQCTEEELIDKPTKPYNWIIENINSGKIKALWIICTNPRHSWANNETFKEAMEKLELFVVQDIYDDTDSSKDCSVYFPVVPGLKKEGTYINTERRLSAMRPVVPKKENEVNDFEVIYGIGKAMGMGHMLDLWKTPKDVFELMKKCSKGMPCDISGIEWEDLENSSGIQWPLREGEHRTEEEVRLYEDGNFFTPSKRAKFMFEDPMEDPLPTNENYPYLLNTGRGTVGQWHTQTRTREVTYIEDAASKTPYIYLNPELAKEHGIEDNDWVSVSSINGQTREFMAVLTECQLYGQLYAPIHYIETNALTPSIYDPYSKEPSYKTVPVAIQKGEGKAYETN